MTTRNELRAALKARLARITLANGYHFDIGDD